MKRIYFLLALGLLASAVPVWAQDFELQHFRCYPVLKVDPEVRGTVDLQDQFNAPPLPFERVDSCWLSGSVIPRGNFTLESRTLFFPSQTIDST